MPRGDGYGGRPAQRWVASVLDRFGTTCHLCHHPGAESADHIIPRSVLAQRGLLARLYWTSNGRPVHHKPCPVCRVRCNTHRKDKPLPGAIAHDDVRFFETGAGP